MYTFTPAFWKFENPPAVELRSSHPKTLTHCFLNSLRFPIFKMFHPSSNTARTNAHTSISTLKSLVNFCSRDFLFHKEFDDSTLAKRHIVVGDFVRSDTGHVMQDIDVTRHSRITQQLVPSTTALSFVCCSQFACKKKVAHDFRYDPRICACKSDRDMADLILVQNVNTCLLTVNNYAYQCKPLCYRKPLPEKPC